MGREDASHGPVNGSSLIAVSWGFTASALSAHDQAMAIRKPARSQWMSPQQFQSEALQRRSEVCLGPGVLGLGFIVNGPSSDTGFPEVRIHGRPRLQGHISIRDAS